MILTCPACGTQYVVKDGAIPEGGRKVRCAACRHSWHQDPEATGTLELQDPVEGSPPVADPADYQTDIAEGYREEPAPPDDRDATEDYSENSAVVDYPANSEPAPVEPGPAFAPPGEDRIEPAYDQDDEFSPFADREPVEERRRGPLFALILVVLIVAASAALFWFLAPPEWKERVGLDATGQTPLQLMMTHSDRQALESGNELLAVSGRVINPTSTAQAVPPIEAELRSKTGKVVYRWTIAPPTRTLAPGASAPFNSAEVNVPAGGEELTVTLGPSGT